MGVMDGVRFKSDSGLIRVNISDYRGVIRVMNEFEKGCTTALRRDYRRIAKPAQVKVSSAISSIGGPPISGMTPKVDTGIPGRTTWGTHTPANKVTVETRAPRLRKGKGTSIVRLRVKSPATVIADMAGTVGKYDRTPRTRVYYYKGPTKGKPAGFIGTRSHANNGQGRGMVKGLNGFKSRGRKSRFVYPAFDSVAPAIRREAALVLMKAIDQFNSRMMSGM